MLASGGSSGERGLFVFDSPAFAEFAGTLMRPSVARPGAAGSPPVRGPRIAFVAAASPIHATASAVRMLEGGPVEFDPVPVTLELDRIVGRLNELKPTTLYGYPSILARLAHEQMAGRLRIAPSAVSTTSESLRDPLRRAIRAAFGVPIVDIYGSSEGLVGATEPDHPVHTFATDSCIVELVDERDEPVTRSTPSASVLVTNLFNTVQPLVRYRIEDQFVRRPDAEDHGHLRAEVEGRAPELLHYGGLAVHPLVITSPLTRSRRCSSTRSARQSSAPTSTSSSRGPWTMPPWPARCGRVLGAAGLPDAVVRLRVVDGLAHDPATGKLRVVVPSGPDLS